MLIKPTANSINKYQNQKICLNPQYHSKAINFYGIKLAEPAQNDTIQLTKDTYISETFIKSLTKIKGKNNLDKFIKIKNAILKQMGYKNPEALKIKITDSENLKCYYNPENGYINFTKGIINSPDESRIPYLYHELDHVDKLVKLYKATGEKEFKTNIIEAKKKLTRKLDIKDKNECTVNINKSFYEKMSKNVDISDFNQHLWNKAFREYISGASESFHDLYEYFKNPLECSALEIESTVRKKLGISPHTQKDYFPKNFISMLRHLKEYGINDIEEQNKILNIVVDFAHIKNANIDLIKLLKKINDGHYITEEEKNYLETIPTQIDNNPAFKTVEFRQKTYLDAELYLQNGKFTPEKIVDYICNNLT